MTASLATPTLYPYASVQAGKWHVLRPTDRDLHVTDNVSTMCSRGIRVHNVAETAEDVARWSNGLCSVCESRYSIELARADAERYSREFAAAYQEATEAGWDWFEAREWATLVTTR